jgi:hypothetical protein
MVNGPSVASREVSGHLVLPHRWEVAGHLASQDRALPNASPKIEV